MEDQNELKRPEKVEKPEGDVSLPEEPKKAKKRVKKKVKRTLSKGRDLSSSIKKESSKKSTENNGSKVPGKKKLKVTQWDKKHVLKWLDKTGLSSEFKDHNLPEMFSKNEINGKALLLLNSDDLKEMGVVAIGVRKALLFHIDHIKKQLRAESQEKLESVSLASSLSDTTLLEEPQKRKSGDKKGKITPRSRAQTNMAKKGLEPTEESVEELEGRMRANSPLPSSSSSTSPFSPNSGSSPPKGSPKISLSSANSSSIFLGGFFFPL